MPDIFDEVQEDLRAEAARRMARRYSGLAVAALLLILVGTGAFVWWQNRQKETTDAAASRYLDAARDADKTKPEAVAPLAALAASGPEGYRTLARLRLAALQWGLGHHDQAAVTWQALSDDTSAPRLLRDLATLSRLQHQIDAGDPQTIKQQAEALTAPDNAWRPMAEQVVALADLRQGKPAEALAVMKRLSTDPQAPPGIREMAGDLMQAIHVPDAPAAAPAPGAKPAGAPASPSAPAAASSSPAHTPPAKGSGTH